MSIQTLIDDYSRQYSWRSWPIILDALPSCEGRIVLDLGCGIGDLASDFSARGARVTGVDANEDFLQFARGRGIRNAEFRAADLRLFSEPSLQADGIWSSFTAAYFPQFDETLSAWAQCLRPGGWIALTEVDDLFGHLPLLDRTQELLADYAKDSLASSRYDFHMGRKLEPFLRQTGFVVSKVLSLPDAELSFTGPAQSDVLDAWKTRFNRMSMLRSFCGEEFESVQEDFLRCLAHQEHQSIARVMGLIAIKLR